MKGPPSNEAGEAMSSIKSWLRNVGFVYRLNGALKCAFVKSRYNATVKRYAAQTVRSVYKSPLLNPEGCSVKVFFMGTDEQQDKSGFVQALERVADVRCFTRDDGSWGQNDPAFYAARRERNTQRLWALLAEHAQRGWHADILLMQTWGCLLDPAILSRIRDAYGTLICNISMDDRHQYWGSKVNGDWDGTYPLIPHLDLALTAAPEAADWYRKEGCAALYFPEASDTSLFHPMPESGKVYDVSFVGSRYGIREQIVLALRRAGIQVTAYGSGWESGRIATEEVPRLFAQSRIVLGVSSIGHCADFVGLKLRDFDAPISGSCYLTQHNDDLNDLYAIGKEIVTYHSIGDCVNKARYLLANKVEREAIASAGRARALQDHTWDNRFEMLLRALRGGIDVWH
jgi:spore maturation protein CgeB